RQVARARPGPPMARRHDVADHPRAVRAAAHRRDVDVYGDEAGLVVIGRGVAGRTELAVELFDATARSKGHGRRLLAAALGCRPEGERCWAQIAPGNAASLRSALAVGFVPIGAEVVIAPSS
ncbi:MAG: hypothetical protein H0U21_10785, partial [Acidimicrobiia bacterium]|nr:hypothetical protein [Acidimicrobiia bacterium]